MGPYQTLRAHNWWTQLLVRFRVFFILKNHGNHLNGVSNLKFQGRVNVGKTSPCQECPGTRPNGFLLKSMDFQVLGQKIYPIPKMIRPKMMPWSISIHWNVPNVSLDSTKFKKSRNLANPIQNPRNLIHFLLSFLVRVTLV